MEARVQALCSIVGDSQLTRSPALGSSMMPSLRIAVSVYVLVAIIKKRLELSASLYEILQILSLTMFERMPINQLLSPQPQASDERVSPNQLSLFK
jgi:hypothetical protein